MIYGISVSCVSRTVYETMLAGKLWCYIEFADFDLYLLVGPGANPGTFEYLSSLSVLNVI
jgi:hypothetical protein